MKCEKCGCETDIIKHIRIDYGFWGDNPSVFYFNCDSDAMVCVPCWNNAPPMNNVHEVEENRNFPLKGNWSLNMFVRQNELFSLRKAPRPYEAILEQHRALVALNVSRLTGRAVKLDSLGGHDALPYSDSIRRWLFRSYKIIK